MDVVEEKEGTKVVILSRRRVYGKERAFVYRERKTPFLLLIILLVTKQRKSNYIIVVSGEAAQFMMILTTWPVYLRKQEEILAGLFIG